MTGVVGVAITIAAAGPMAPVPVILLGAAVLAVLVALVCWFDERLVLASACVVAAVFVAQSWNPEIVPLEPCFFCGVADVPIGGVLFVGALLAGGRASFRLLRSRDLAARALVAARLRWLVLTLAVLIAGAVVGRFLQAGLLPGARLQTFDAGLWHAEEPAPSGSSLSHRARMLHDLVGAVLPGMSRIEVERLLGEGDYVGPGSSLLYGVTPHPLRGLDEQGLVVEFDDQGRFQSAWIESW